MKTVLKNQPQAKTERLTISSLQLQRKYKTSSAESQNRIGVPPIVSEVLCSPGRPLDYETRPFMEPCVGHDFSRIPVHPDGPATMEPKLIVDTLRGAHEEEANRVAERVVRMSAPPFVQLRGDDQQKKKTCAQPRALASTISPLIQEKGERRCVVGDSIASRIAATRGSGSAMPKGTRSFMENRFGTDFSKVRVHSGDAAVQLSQQLNAHAFTIGDDLYFNSGKFAPHSASGKELLAHELAHTLQQEQGSQIIHRQPSGASSKATNRKPDEPSPGSAKTDTKKDIEKTEENKEVNLSRGVLQLVSEGGFQSGDFDVRKPHFPQNVALFKLLTDTEKEEYAAAIPKKPLLPQRYKGPDAIGIFAKDNAGDFRIESRKKRHEPSTYTESLASDQKLGVLGSGAGSKSGVTIGMGFDIGARGQTQEKTKKWFIDAGLKEADASKLSEAAELRGIKAAEKAATLRGSVTLTFDEVMKMLDKSIPEYDIGYGDKKYKRGDGTFLPVIEEALMNVKYWGNKSYWTSLYNACKGKKKDEQMAAARDATKSWSQKKYYHFFSIVIEMTEAGYAVNMSDSVKDVKTLTGDTDPSLQLVQSIVERNSNFKETKDLKAQLTNRTMSLTPVIEGTVGEGGKNKLADVKAVQRLLYNGKFLDGDLNDCVNGMYDSKTKAAIKAFVISEKKIQSKADELIDPRKDLIKRLKQYEYKTQQPGG